MKVIVPNYYKKFKCIASKCHHNCCIGWEIDIDNDTYSAYKSLPGTMGERLKTSISPLDVPHFILDKEERCPFLNRQGLCDIISELGKDYLCNICADHPRFRNVFSNHIEMGLGLCCEAAASLILNQQEKVFFDTIDDVPLSTEEQQFFHIREQILSIIQDRHLTIEQRLNRLLPDGLPHLPFQKIYKSLERLDSAWDQKIPMINVEAPVQEGRAAILEQLAVYFIYRHLAGALEDGYFSERVAFCILSVKVINSIARSNEEILEISRLYSSEIEYSDENIDVLINTLH